MPDRSPLVARLIMNHPRFAEAGRGRYGTTTAAAFLTSSALKLWPDLTMAEFAAGVARANELATDQRKVERVMRVAGSTL